MSKIVQAAAGGFMAPFRAAVKLAAMGGIVGLVTLYAAALIGACMNIYKLIEMFIHSAPVNGMVVGRILGICVWWIGAVLGYF